MDRAEAAVALAEPERTPLPSRTEAVSEARGTVRAESGDLDAALDEIFSQMAALPRGGVERGRLRTEAIELALPLVSRLARRFWGRGERLDDLTQAGALALVKAVDSSCERGNTASAQRVRRRAGRPDRQLADDRPGQRHS